MLDIKDRIDTKEKLKHTLDIELKKYGIKMRGGGHFVISEEGILAKHNIFLRKAEYYTNSGHKIKSKYYKLRLTLLQNKYGLHIPMNCFKEGLRIMHIGNIVVNNRVKVGKNCSLHVNTGLVAGGVTAESPVLGDGIIVGMGAIVLGGISLADNIAVGANAVVTKNFDEKNIAIAGVPAKKVSSNGSLEWNKKS